MKIRIQTAEELEAEGRPDSSDRKFAGIEKLRLVSIGPVDVSGALYDAMLDKHSFCSTVPLDRQTLWMIADHRELWLIPKHEVVHAAIVHEALNSFELDEVCRYIRRQWPAAKILVIRDGENFLEDALYDDRVMPDVPPQVLLQALEQLLQRRRA